MLEKKLRYDFIAKHSDNCTDEQLLDNHFYYFNKYQNGDFHEPVESFSDCLWYIKKIVNRNSPKELMTLLLKLSGNASNCEIDVVFEYLSLMNLITRLQAFSHFYEDVAYWAKKTLDMIEYFYPSNNALGKEYFSKTSELYTECEELFQKYKKYFNQETYKDFIFLWEHEFYSPTSHANQNLKFPFTV